MSSLVSSCPNFEIIASECAAIGQQGLAEIDATYGSGHPEWGPASVRPLEYHNGHHARAVGEDSARIAQAVGLDSVFVESTRLAGYWHDRVQLKGSGTNEHESAELLSGQMERSGVFSPRLFHLVSLAIAGTEPSFDRNFNIVGQKADELEYPDRETELGSKAVACGDFGELYVPLTPLLSHKLCQEIGKAATPEGLIDFQRNHVYLVESYSYPLKEGWRLATHRREVVQHAHDILKKLVAGQIDNIGQILLQDEAFLRRVS